MSTSSKVASDLTVLGGGINHEDAPKIMVNRPSSVDVSVNSGVINSMHPTIDGKLIHH